TLSADRLVSTKGYDNKLRIPPHLPGGARGGVDVCPWRHHGEPDGVNVFYILHPQLHRLLSGVLQVHQPAATYLQVAGEQGLPLSSRSIRGWTIGFRFPQA